MVYGLGFFRWMMIPCSVLTVVLQVSCPLLFSQQSAVVNRGETLSGNGATNRSKERFR